MNKWVVHYAVRDVQGNVSFLGIDGRISQVSIDRLQ